ncbi:hypothetical protein QBC43DRAFT_326174 [Cladorrhinum sp. PSN259]|nr:hypothetical protein QBC43DRAFT_326174 [Cladorrhinum sp. PSN259]
MPSTSRSSRRAGKISIDRCGHLPIHTVLRITATAGVLYRLASADGNARSYSRSNTQQDQHESNHPQPNPLLQGSYRPSPSSIAQNHHIQFDPQPPFEAQEYRSSPKGTPEVQQAQYEAQHQPQQGQYRSFPLEGSSSRSQVHLVSQQPQQQQTQFHVSQKPVSQQQLTGLVSQQPQQQQGHGYFTIRSHGLPVARRHNNALIDAVRPMFSNLHCWFQLHQRSRD